MNSEWFIIAAVVWLQDGSQAEQVVAKLDRTELLGRKVDVALYRHENFLCVAHLPLNTTNQDFLGLITELGPIERSFLMRDEKGIAGLEINTNKLKMIIQVEHIVILGPVAIEHIKFQYYLILRKIVNAMPVMLVCIMTQLATHLNNASLVLQVDDFIKLEVIVRVVKQANINPKMTQQ